MKVKNRISVFIIRRIWCWKTQHILSRHVAAYGDLY